MSKLPNLTKVICFSWLGFWENSCEGGFHTVFAGGLGLELCLSPSIHDYHNKLNSNFNCFPNLEHVMVINAILAYKQFTMERGKNLADT